MKLSEWKESFCLKVRQGKLYVCPAALKFINDPKIAGSEGKYLKGVASFLRAHTLTLELKEFEDLFVNKAQPVVAPVTPEVEEEELVEKAPEPKVTRRRKK